MTAEAFEVSNKVFQRSNKSFEGAEMSCTVPEEIQQIVRQAAEPSQAGESVKAAIGRAARSLGLSYSRARAHWYGLARMVPAEEADALRRARIQLIRERAARLRAELLALEIKERAHELGLAEGIGCSRLDGNAPDQLGRVVSGEGCRAA
ncbi:hypothetical protein HMPREF9946_02142 [Acetobacteraceae bacterium AT-5844]|nr:hypothetical protein HMPREF9946_02142 [Acetobacteraceae bacterium AT-5844]